MDWKPLKTNYEDEIWEGKKKYSQIFNKDGTVSLDDKTVYQNKEESFLGAKDVNAITSAMNKLAPLLDLITSDGKLVTGAGFHNSIYRGKYLGNTVTDEQYNTIDSGEFNDLFIGDYWTINGINYRIAAFDYYCKRQNPESNRHHVTIIPDTILDQSPLSSNTLVLSSDVDPNTMKKTSLKTACEKIKTAFSNNHILIVDGFFPFEKELRFNRVFIDVKRITWDIAIPSIESITGFQPPYTDVTKRETVGMTSDLCQFPLFTFCPSHIHSNEPYWCMGIINGGDAGNKVACISSLGETYYLSPNQPKGIRPVFSIYKGV